MTKLNLSKCATKVFFSIYFMFSRASLKVIYLGVNLVWQWLRMCARVCVLYLQPWDEALQPASQLHTRDTSFNPETPPNTHTHALTDWQADTRVLMSSPSCNAGQVVVLFTERKRLEVKGNFLFDWSRKSAKVNILRSVISLLEMDLWWLFENKKHIRFTWSSE